MTKYDDSSWHYYGKGFSKSLPQENGSTHIGMFLNWCIDNSLISKYHIENNSDDIVKVQKQEMTGADFLIKNCAEKFTTLDLSELGNEFSKDYYIKGTDFIREYMTDYCDEFFFEVENEGVYHIENTFDNYQRIKPWIDKRFEEWKNYRGR